MHVALGRVASAAEKDLQHIKQEEEGDCLEDGKDVGEVEEAALKEEVAGGRDWHGDGGVKCGDKPARATKGARRLIIYCLK